MSISYNIIIADTLHTFKQNPYKIKKIAKQHNLAAYSSVFATITAPNPSSKEHAGSKTNV